MKKIRLNNTPGRQFQFQGQSYLYFGGTSYLGLQSHTEFQNILKSHISSYGTHFGASRLSNVGLDIYNKVETRMSAWVGCESCIVLSSGYLAGQMIAQFFHQHGHPLYYAPNTHAALSTGRNTPYKNYDSLESDVKAYLRNSPQKQPVIILDTIQISGAHYPEFDWLKRLPLEDCILVADDSHGIGIIGEEGNGAYNKLAALGPGELLICCSLGKALGLAAGSIFGNCKYLDQFRATALYAGASPPSPAFMATWLEAQPIYHSQRSRLKMLISLMNQSIDRLEKLQFLGDYPVYLYQDSMLGNHLFEKQIITTHFDYPAEQQTQQNRIVLSAAHTEADIAEVSSEINRFYKKNHS